MHSNNRYQTQGSPGSAQLNRRRRTKAVVDSNLKFLGTNARSEVRAQRAAERTADANQFFDLRRSKSASSMGRSGSGWTMIDRSMVSMDDLREQIMQLKRKLVVIESENTMLRTKLIRTQNVTHKQTQELSARDTQQMRLHVVTPGSSRTRSHTSVATSDSANLKLIRLQHQLQHSNDEIQKLRSQLKNTRMTEMEHQMKVFYSEVQRLKHKLSSSVSVVTADQLDGVDDGTQIDALNNALQTQVKRNVELTDLLRQSEERLQKMHNQADKQNGKTAIGQRDAELRAELKSEKRKCIELQKTLADAKKECETSKEKAAKLQQRLNKQEEIRNEMEIRESKMREESESLKESLRSAQSEVDHLTNELKRVENNLERERAILKSNIDTSDIHNSTGAIFDPESRMADECDAAKFDETGSAYKNSQTETSRDNRLLDSIVEPNQTSADIDGREARLEEIQRNRAAKTIQRRWKNYERDQACNLVAHTANAHFRRVQLLNNKQ